MKKVYMLGVLLVAVSTAGCTLKGPTIPELSTGNTQIITGTVLTGAETGTITTGEVLVWTALTWSFDSWIVPVVTGSNEATPGQSWVTADVKALIDERNAQSGDTKKLTEEDIGLMEQIIQKIQKLGK